MLRNWGETWGFPSPPVILRTSPGKWASVVCPAGTPDASTTIRKRDGIMDGGRGVVRGFPVSVKGDKKTK